MEIKLLTEGYKKDELFFREFCENRLWQGNYISEETVEAPEMPDFPIYFGKMKGEEKKSAFLQLLQMIEENVLLMDRDIYMDERFWHSYICLYKYDFLVETYPQVLQDVHTFRNIVTKSFDWENYIYKAVLAAQYVTDQVKSGDSAQRIRYYSLILENMDLYNYIIKYEIFRNSNFLIHILDIIDETGLGKVLKAKIKDRPDMGKDERYGRRVIFEFNKSYPIVLAPMLNKEQLKEFFLTYLSYYYSGEEISEKSEF